MAGEKPHPFMCDGPNNDRAFLLRVNNGKRKSLKKEPSSVALTQWPSFRTFADRRDLSI